MARSEPMNISRRDAKLPKAENVPSLMALVLRLLARDGNLRGYVGAWGLKISAADLFAPQLESFTWTLTHWKE